MARHIGGARRADWAQIHTKDSIADLVHLGNVKIQAEAQTFEPFSRETAGMRRRDAGHCADAPHKTE